MVYISDFCKRVCRLSVFLVLACILMANGKKERSIVFVIDTTSSMGEELQQFKEHVMSLLEHIETVEHGVTLFNYIFVTFNDRYLDSQAITGNKKEFLTLLNNLMPSGGDNCSKLSLKALRKGLQLCKNKCYVFLFTNADSKERVIPKPLLDLILLKKPLLHLIITGHCTKELDPIYKELALKSEGQLFNVTKEDVGTLLNDIGSNLTSAVLEKKNVSQFLGKQPLEMITSPSKTETATPAKSEEAPPSKFDERKKAPRSTLKIPDKPEEAPPPKPEQQEKTTSSKLDELKTVPQSTLKIPDKPEEAPPPQPEQQEETTSSKLDEPKTVPWSTLKNPETPQKAPPSILVEPTKDPQSALGPVEDVVSQQVNKDVPQSSAKQPLFKLIFSQRPSIAFENDDILFNCSIPPQTHMESQTPIALTILFNGSQVINNTHNDSIQYRINSSDHTANGEYECVASNHEFDAVKIDLIVNSKDYVKSNVETLHVINGTKFNVSCPLNFTDNQNAILGWQKNNDVIEDPDMTVLTIDRTEIDSLRYLKCYRIDKNLTTKEEVTYKITIGANPLLTATDHSVQNLSAIQSLDGNGADLKDINANNKSSVSIIFVIDTTSSMGDELRQIREHVMSLLEHIEKVEDSSTTFNYILIPFNDPRLGIPSITGSKKELLTLLNDLTPSGGYKCPKPSLMALKIGLERSENMSYVFLFTDADASQRVILPKLRKLIKTKRPSLHLFITGHCGTTLDPIYEELASISNGKLFNDSKKDLGTLLSNIGSNLKPLKDLFQSSGEQPLPKITFMQHPSIAFENDNISFNCSLSSPQTHIASLSPIKLTIYVNGRQKILHEKLIRNGQNDSIQYRINSGDHHANGEYECVASSDSLESDAVKIDLTVGSVRSKMETLPVMKGTDLNISCPLDFTDNENAVLGWQKNDDIIEDPDMKVLTIDPAETDSLHSLKCFRIDKNLKTKEEVTYNIIVGEKPLLSATVIHDKFTNKIILSCDVVVKHLSSIQIFDGTMERSIADLRDYDSDLHVEHIRLTRDHHSFKLFLRTEDFLTYKQPFSCVVHSLFGSEKDEMSGKTSNTSSEIPQKDTCVPCERQEEIICSNWSPFTPCSVTCGTGFRTRTQSCHVPYSKTIFEVTMCHNPCTKVAKRIENGPENNENRTKRCMKGFTLSSYKDICVDVNECRIRNMCPKKMKCDNTRGSYKCMTCPKGFMGINGRCLDINECSLKTHKCSQICVNVDGSYRCDCKNGFQLHSDGITCEYLGFH